MVQSLLPPDQASPSPVTVYTNHASRGTANNACTNISWAQDGDKNPFHVIWTTFELLLDSPGETYLERKGSIWSSALILGLLSEISESHSCVSTAKSSKSSPYSELVSVGGLSGGMLTLMPVVISGDAVARTGKCTSSGSGVRTVIRQHLNARSV
jgi:putative Ca2+/H+ antiporter (TMEM165/GDT1 family)